MEVINKYSIDIITIGITVISVIFSVLLSINANKKSNKANEIANSANKLAEEANRITKISVFNRYYDNLYRIEKELEKISDCLDGDIDVIKSEELTFQLNQWLKSIIEGNHDITFPDGTNKIFNEIHDCCKLISQRISKLKGGMISFNNDYDGAIHVDDDQESVLHEYFTTYELKNLSEELQRERKVESNEIIDLINELRKTIVLNMENKYI